MATKTDVVETAVDVVAEVVSENASSPLNHRVVIGVTVGVGFVLGATAVFAGYKIYKSRQAKNAEVVEETVEA
jgi:hypothetical protein